MESELPDPPVPPDLDLRDFRWMPLDVVRVRDSTIMAIRNAEVFRCAVRAWCIAWHQVPASSLPPDGILLARMLQIQPVRKWRRLCQQGALHGFVLCNDGRLYHPVIAQKALEAWTFKQAQRNRTAAARAAKAALSQRQSQRPVTDDVTSIVTGSTRQDRTGQDRNNLFSARVTGAENGGEKTLPDFLSIDSWKAYVEMRVRIGKPLTDDTAAIAIRQLIKLKEFGSDPNESLDQATLGEHCNLVTPHRGRHGNGGTVPIVDITKVDFSKFDKR